MAHFEIEDDDNDVNYDFGSKWNANKKGGSSAFFGGGGGGDEDNMYDFAFEEQPATKQKRNAQFSPESSTSSYGGKPASKPVAKTEAPKPTGNSALDMANNLLAKYASKANASAAAPARPFAKKPYSADFDVDDLSVGSDDVEEFDLSESSGVKQKSKFITKPAAKSAVPTSQAAKKQAPPSKSAFEMSNSFETSFDDVKPKGGKKELPSLMMPTEDEDEEEESYQSKPKANTNKQEALKGAPAAASKPNLALRVPSEDDSVYRGDEVSEEEDASAVDESIAMDESMASSEGGARKGSVAVQYAVKSGPVATSAIPASYAVKAASAPAPVPAPVSRGSLLANDVSANLDYSVEFEDDFEEDLNDRYGIDMSQIHATDDHYDNEREEEESTKQAEPSGPRIMKFSDLQDIMIAPEDIVTSPVKELPKSSDSKPANQSEAVKAVVPKEEERVESRFEPQLPPSRTTLVRESQPTITAPAPAPASLPPKISNPPRYAAAVETSQYDPPTKKTDETDAPATSPAMLPNLMYTSLDPIPSGRQAPQAASTSHANVNPPSTQPANYPNGYPSQPTIQPPIGYPAPSQYAAQSAQESHPNAYPPVPQPIPAYVPPGYMQAPFPQPQVNASLGMYPPQPPQFPTNPYANPYQSLSGMPGMLPAGFNPYQSGFNPLAMSMSMGMPGMNMGNGAYGMPMNQFAPYGSMNMGMNGMGMFMQQPPNNGSASQLMASSLPGMPSASMSSVSEPLLKDLLKELKEAKDDAAWAKNKLAEMILLMQSKSENDGKIKGARSALASTRPTTNKYHSNAAEDESYITKSYSDDDFEEEYSNDFDNDGEPNIASKPSAAAAQSGKGKGNSRPARKAERVSTKTDQFSADDYLRRGGHPNYRQEQQQLDAASMGLYPRSVPGLGGDIDISSSLVTSQALFRRQLQSLRDRLNFTTASLGHNIYSMDSAPIASTKELTGEKFMRTPLFSAISANNNSINAASRPTQVLQDENAHQKENKLKLWEVIMQTQPHLDELSAKELAIRYSAAL